MKKILFLFLFVSCYTFGQQEVKVDLRNPNSTLYTHIYFLMPDSYDLDKAASTIRGLPKDQAREKAKKIKQIMDGNGLIVDFAKIPIDPNYTDTVNFGMRTQEQNKHRYVPFPIRLPKVYIEKIGNNWYYSQETLAQVDALYEKTFPYDLSGLNDRFPRFFQTSVLGVSIWKPLLALFMLIVSVIMYYVLEPLFFSALKFLQKNLFKGFFSTNSMGILRELARPIVLLVIVRFLTTWIALTSIG